uniref:Uncharacterized protein n=1 Tax=Steinernema glaseri TaxID=37863 RepID=A0A1I7ZS07_9BILA
MATRNLDSPVEAQNFQVNAAHDAFIIKLVFSNLIPSLLFLCRRSSVVRLVPPGSPSLTVHIEGNVSSGPFCHDHVRMAIEF